MIVVSMEARKTRTSYCDSNVAVLILHNGGGKENQEKLIGIEVGDENREWNKE